MEKTWTPEELKEILPRIISRWPGAARLLQSRSAQERIRLVTRSANGEPPAVIGDEASGRGELDTDHHRRTLDVPTVQTLVCHRDDGVCFGHTPTSVNLTRVYLRARGSTRFQSQNLTRLELHKSACTPLHIIGICTACPSLQTLCVYTDCGEAEKKRWDPFVISDGVYLSDALAKLRDLKTLDLDLHYNCDYSHLLGPRGVLNLQKLLGLENVVLPLHYLVEKTSAGGHVVTYPSAVLPPSLRRLHLKADSMCLVFWRGGFSGPGDEQTNAAVTGYESATTLLEFLGAVSACVPYYFANIELVTYTYGSKHPLGDDVGSRSEETPAFPRGALGPEADVDDKMTRFGVLAEDFDRNGVRFEVGLELATH